jgi:hypothetical protein
MDLVIDQKSPNYLIKKRSPKSTLYLIDLQKDYFTLESEGVPRLIGD